MGKAILLPVQPKWCEKICHKIGENADGTPIYEKSVEVRKTRPKIDTPFTVYIYQTKKTWVYNIFSKIADWQSKVIGEFVCDEITKCCSEFYPEEEQPVFEALYRLREEDEYQRIWDCIASNDADTASKFLKETCLILEDFREYLGNGEKEFYAWHISNLVIYDKPKELEEFKQCHKCEYYANCFEHEYSCDGVYNLTRPPQSWCYVESAGV